MIKRWIIRFSARRCRGCTDPNFHTHHLTWLGRWRYMREEAGR